MGEKFLLSISYLSNVVVRNIINSSDSQSVRDNRKPRDPVSKGTLRPDRKRGILRNSGMLMWA